MKVFIVQRGCYSDRYVSGVFSSQEKAEANIALHSDRDNPRDGLNSAGDITEYLVDEQAEDIEKMRYEVNVDLISGAILSQSQHKWFGPPNELSEAPELQDFRHIGNYSLSPVFGRLSGKIISYRSAEHAIKLAAEFRQKYLREQSVTG